jgi:hypothetical protein
MTSQDAQHASQDTRENQQTLLWKTKMCTFFQQGRCRYGMKCGFAHDQGELVSQPDLIKTSLCVGWSLGTCHLSSAKCRFAHGQHELRRAVLPSKEDQTSKQKKPTPLLLTPPGLDVILSPDDVLSVAMPVGKVHKDAGKKPMKVQSPLQKPIYSEFEPMKVLSPLFDDGFGSLAAVPPQWDHWESETITGETSSDDDGGTLSPMWSFPQAEPDFENEYIFAHNNAMGSFGLTDTIWGSFPIEDGIASSTMWGMPPSW